MRRSFDLDDFPVKPKRGRWTPILICLVLSGLTGFVAGFVTNFILSARFGL